MYIYLWPTRILMLSVSDRVRVRVRVTELVEPVLVL